MYLPNGADEGGRSKGLGSLRPGADLDARGTPISSDLLEKLLDSVRVDGESAFGTANFRLAHFERADFDGVRFEGAWFTVTGRRSTGYGVPFPVWS